MRRTLSILLAVAVVASAAGCGQGRSPKTPPSPPPCAANPASSVELGMPIEEFAPDAATVETRGATFYITLPQDPRTPPQSPP